MVERADGDVPPVADDVVVVVVDKNPEKCIGGGQAKLFQFFLWNLSSIVAPSVGFSFLLGLWRENWLELKGAGKSISVEFDGLPVIFDLPVQKYIFL